MSTLFQINVLQCKYSLNSNNLNKNKYYKHLHSLNIDWKWCSKITPKFSNTINKGNKIKGLEQSKLCLNCNFRLSGIVLRCYPTRNGPKGLSHQGYSTEAVPPGMVIRGYPTREGPRAVPPGMVLMFCPKTCMTIQTGNINYASFRAAPKEHPWWDNP